jgi:hypothetical protein
MTWSPDAGPARDHFLGTGWLSFRANGLRTRRGDALASTARIAVSLIEVNILNDVEGDGSVLDLNVG